MDPGKKRAESQHQRNRADINEPTKSIHGLRFIDGTPQEIGAEQSRQPPQLHRPWIPTRPGSQLQGAPAHDELDKRQQDHRRHHDTQHRSNHHAPQSPPISDEGVERPGHQGQQRAFGLAPQDTDTDDHCKDRDTPAGHARKKAFHAPEPPAQTHRYRGVGVKQEKDLVTGELKGRCSGSGSPRRKPYPSQKQKHSRACQKQLQQCRPFIGCFQRDGKQDEVER